MTYGTLCSDGQRVFALLETGFLGQDDLKVGPLPETHVLSAGMTMSSPASTWPAAG